MLVLLLVMETLKVLGEIEYFHHCQGSFSTLPSAPNTLNHLSLSLQKANLTLDYYEIDLTLLNDLIFFFEHENDHFRAQCVRFGSIYW